MTESRSIEAFLARNGWGGVIQLAQPHTEIAGWVGPVIMVPREQLDGVHQLAERELRR